MACECPEGYILLEDGVTCQQILNAPAVPPAVKVAIDINIEGGATPGVYGLLTYENITSNQSGGSKQWPLILTPQITPGVVTMSVIPNTGPNWTSISPAGNPPDGEHQLVNVAVPGSWPPFPNMNFVSPGTCLRESVVTADVLYYGIGNPVMPTNNNTVFPWSGGTWANDVGIWPSDLLLTNYKWVGLSACINVEVETTYYVLFTANNAFRIKIDGQLAVEMNVGDGLVIPLAFVNAFPITLSPGIHNINVEAFNFSGGGQFSCDILNISEADLLAINNLPSIDAYRIFSSKWKKPRTITATSNGTTTITSAGEFLLTDVGAFLNIPGYPPDTYIVEVVDINTVIVNQTVTAMTDTGQLFFIWESGDTVDNTWTCPEGYEFGNCDGPNCFQESIEPCVPVDGCFLLTPCDPELDPIIVNNDSSAYLGQIVVICPENLPAPTPPITQTGVRMRGIGNETYSYLGTLTPCCPGKEPVYTNNDSFASYEGLALVIPSLDANTCWIYSQGTNGHDGEAVSVNITDAYVYADCATCTFVNPCAIVPTLENCTCYTVSSTQCQNSISLILTGPLDTGLTCEACLTSREPKCYLLVNCVSQETIITNTNLEDYVGSVIKLLETCPDKCWRVFDSEDCQGAISVAQAIEVFTDCDTCLPPVPEVPVNLKTRAVKPGFYTTGCSPEYTLKTNCRFAEMVYSNMLTKRYGITPCCSIADTNKWLLDKKILDLDAIYDPSLCVSTITRCCPVTCLEVSLEFFNPSSCPSIDGLSVTILES